MRVYSGGERVCLKFALRSFAPFTGVTGTQDDNVGRGEHSCFRARIANRRTQAAEQKPQP